MFPCSKTTTSRKSSESFNAQFRFEAFNVLIAQFPAPVDKGRTPLRFQQERCLTVPVRLTETIDVKAIADSAQDHMVKLFHVA